jgi:Protein of unknown function (DUF4019)
MVDQPRIFVVAGSAWPPYQTVWPSLRSKPVIKRLMLTFTIICSLVGTIAMAQDRNIEATKKGAESWLAIVDRGDCAASYDEAARIFKLAVAKEDWLQRVRAARGPLGKVISRKLKGAQYKTALPGAPDGEYVVIQYDTSFDNKRSAVETITMTLDKDAQWRVSGYFIR